MTRLEYFVLSIIVGKENRGIYLTTQNNFRSNLYEVQNVLDKLKIKYQVIKFAHLFNSLAYFLHYYSQMEN